MAKKKGGGDDYEVGYGKPPKEHQYKPGENSQLRQKKKRKRVRKKNEPLTNIDRILDDPVNVKVGGKEQKMSPFESGFRSQIKKALAGSLPDLGRVIKTCELYGLIQKDPDALPTSGVLRMPKDHDLSVEEWVLLHGLETPDNEREEAFQRLIWEPYVKHRKEQSLEQRRRN